MSAASDGALSIEAALAARREAYAGPQYTEARATLKRLEQDPRMSRAWSSILKRARDQADLDRVIGVIVEAKNKAVLFDQMGDWEEAWKEEYDRVTDAIVTLADYFKKRPALIALPEMPAFKASLAWALGFINEHHFDKLETLAADFPTTRTRNQPLPAFYKILCHELTELFGTPLHAFVAVAAQVAFGLRTEISEATVAAAYRRERENRSPSGPPTAQLEIDAQQ